MPIIEAAGNTSIESNSADFSAIYIKTRDSSAVLQGLVYAQSKSYTPQRTATNTGWIPIAAETQDKKTTVVIKDVLQGPENVYQAIDFDPITGSIVGIHRTDGGYKTRDQIEADMRTSREAVDMEFLYFTGDKENEFLARFDWVINPNGSASKSEGSQTSAIISSPSTYGRTSSQRISSFNPKNSTPLQIDLSSFKNAVGTIRIVGRARDLTKALATETNFLYLKSTGELFYDENGISAGFGNGGIFAVLENRPSLLKSNLAFI